MPSEYGFYGTLLEINLTEGKINQKKLTPDLIENYLGGRGLATRILYENIDPSCDPLGEHNVLVIATSPLLKTKAPTACRGHMVFKSPLTGMLGSSNCGGTWASRLKSTGYDALMIKGKASQPVQVDIQREKTEIRPAAEVWGKDVHQTTDILSSQKNSSPSPGILTIGPAGENLCLYSAVMNDKNRAYGRSGPGAVFGSKNLKAITVTGKMSPPLKDKERFQSGLDQALYMMKAAPITKRLLRELGTSGLLKLIHLMDMLPHQNFQDNLHNMKELDKISGETLRESILERVGACYGCPVACQTHTRVGEKKGEGPEYETLVMIGPNCGIYNLKAVALANYRCNELGLDTISLGGTLACAMELYEKGILDKKTTGGIPLNFGNESLLPRLVDLIAYRKAFGEKLAEGSFRLASDFHHPELSMTIKKMEIPAYDPRSSFTQALGYMTSPTGACHLRGGYAVSLAFFGGTKEIPRFSIQQSPLAIRNMQNLGIIQDSLGICRFTGFAFSTEPWARMMSGATGMDFSTSQLQKISHRIASMERAFNLQAGLKEEDDCLPDRFSHESIGVEGKDKLISPELIQRMRRDYYQSRGWSPKGKLSTLIRADLQLNKRYT